MQVIRYVEYEQYEKRRQEANTAINAMLAGCRIASHFLTLTHGATRPLAEIFPSIPRVKGFNLRTQVASDVLNDAEHHLGMMAVPFVQGIHEDYAMTCLKLLNAHGSLSNRRLANASAKTLHSTFETSGERLDSDSAEIFQLLRLMRNDVIHNGGIACDELAVACTDLSPEARVLWTTVTTQDPPAYAVGHVVRLGFSETIAELAVTKRLARAMNLALGRALPRSFWISELRLNFAGRKNLPPLSQPEKRLNMAMSIARHTYGPLNFERCEIEVELDTHSLLRRRKNGALPD